MYPGEVHVGVRLDNGALTVVRASQKGQHWDLTH
jgi:hypothetical protein